jgi:transposase
MATWIGIDVHKASLVVAVLDGPIWTVERTPAALTTLALRLQALQPPGIVLEPSGGYEQLVLDVLWQHALPVARVQPRQVRAFIRGVGIAAKSDRLDARLLARFGQLTAPRLTPAPTPTQQRVARLSAWRRTLRADLAAKTHQRQNQPPEIVTSIDQVVAALEAECAALTATIADLVATAPEWARPRQILASVPGIGPITVALLLAELPELGQRDPKSLASLVGVAPFSQESGTHVGTAHIAGGRRAVRTGLWMPTRSAIIHNPVIATFATRLRDERKPEKVVTIACLHKLLTILNAMVRNDECWNPRPHPA